MKALSFQLRIALLSAFLSGLVSLTSGAAFLALIYRTGLQRIDREIRALGEGQTRQRLERFSGGRFEESLRYIYGNDAADRIALRLLDFAGEVFYESPDWPDGLDEAAIPLPAFSGSRPDRPDPRGDEPPPFERERGPPPMREARYVTLEANGMTWRVGVVGHEMATAVIAFNLKSLRAENARFRNLFLAVAPVVLLLLAAAGWQLARRALRPVNLITEKAERITARDLHERIPVVRSDQEFARLVDVINGMLERLERSFGQAARFSADAAHELKTPLTILQGRLEQGVQESENGSAQQRVFADLLDEVQRLKSITRKLLLLARADAGSLPLARETVDLSAAVSNACDDIRTLAPEITLKPDIQPGVYVHADADLLRQAIQNLASNAVKFNVPNGSIEIRLTAADAAVLDVANTSIALRDEDREKLFERFFRAEASHHRGVDGSGLGLSLSREIARAHGGDVRILPGRDGWTRFELRLPLESRET